MPGSAAAAAAAARTAAAARCPSPSPSPCLPAPRAAAPGGRSRRDDPNLSGFQRAGDGRGGRRGGRGGPYRRGHGEGRRRGQRHPSERPGHHLLPAAVSSPARAGDPALDPRRWDGIHFASSSTTHMHISRAHFTCPLLYRWKKRGRGITVRTQRHSLGCTGEVKSDLALPRVPQPRTFAPLSLASCCREVWRKRTRCFCKVWDFRPLAAECAPCLGFFLCVCVCGSGSLGVN